MKGASLFCSAGIAETYFKESGIEIAVASELLQKRCELHSWLYPTCTTICGDITQENIFEAVKEEILKKDCKFLLATPPCQGMSSMGKKDYVADKRNYLIFYAFDMMDICDFDYILIENVPKFLELYFPFDNSLFKLEDIIRKKYADSYNIESLF